MALPMDVPDPVQMPPEWPFRFNTGQLSLLDYERSSKMLGVL